MLPLVKGGVNTPPAKSACGAVATPPFIFFGPGGGGYVPRTIYYLGSTGDAGITPSQCTSGTAPQSTGNTVEYLPTSSAYRDVNYFTADASCQPSPTPTPPPISAQVTEVGFTGDKIVYKFNKGADVNNPQAYNPDGQTPSWKKDKNPKAPVAYVRGDQVTMFATIMLSPAPPAGTTANIRVKNGSNVIATKDGVSLSGGSVRITGINVTAQLEDPTLVKKGSYKFSWEISFDGGSIWKSMGTSGSHDIYWLYAAPIQNEFTNAFGTTYDQLYDEALYRSVGKVKGSAVVDDIILTITQKQSKDINYNPGRLPQNEHPLRRYIDTKHDAVCQENALILRGLLRSIGIDATAKYYWGGNPTTKQAYNYKLGNIDFPYNFRIIKPALFNANGTLSVEANPHFNYHAVVSAGNNATLYDASYGSKSQSIDFDETFNKEEDRFTIGTSDSATHQVVNDTLIVSNNPYNSNRSCRHTPISSLTPNPIDDSGTFVAQQYHDFLGREADSGGLDYWTGQITNCGSDTTCINNKRLDVSQAFFLSNEFQKTGKFVYLFYKATYNRQPRYEEWLVGQRNVGDGYIDGAPGADALLLANQTDFADGWVEKDDFRAIYDGMSNDQFVDAIYANMGVTLSITNKLIILSILNGGETRSDFLRSTITDSTFQANEDHPSFVLMEYFGFLRRNPDDPPDNNMDGYNFWLNQYNSNNNQRSMIQAFITSAEYRQRFGQS